jgi:hypothetical protein
MAGVKRTITGIVLGLDLGADATGKTQAASGGAGCRWTATAWPAGRSHARDEVAAEEKNQIEVWKRFRFSETIR